MICSNPRCPHRERYGEPAELPQGTRACPACGRPLEEDPSAATEEEHGARPVTIAEFGEPHAAYLAKGRLEVEGLAARVAGEHLASLNAMFADTGGMIRLEVAPGDAERAIEILDRDHSGTIAGEPEAIEVPAPRTRVCPGCGSASVEEDRGRGSPLGALVAALRGTRLRCFTCGHRWRPRSGDS